MSELTHVLILMLVGLLFLTMQYALGRGQHWIANAFGCMLMVFFASIILYTTFPLND